MGLFDNRTARHLATVDKAVGAGKMTAAEARRERALIRQEARQDEQRAREYGTGH